MWKVNVMFKRRNMKRIIIVILYIILPLLVSAQTGLNANAVFAGKVVPRDRMVEVRVRGRTLSRYKLNYYHSVRFVASSVELSTINELVGKDRRSALSVEDRHSGSEATQLMGLQPRGSLNRYLCFMTKGRGKHVTITLVYMEGSVKSIEELRKMID